MRYGYQLAKEYHPSDFADGPLVAEIKYDGVLCMIEDGKLLNRKGEDISGRFPEIEKTDKAVLVGEVGVMNGNGLMDFSLTQQRHLSRPSAIEAGVKSLPATFVAFDILELGSPWTNDLSRISLFERRQALGLFLEFNPLSHVKLVDQIPVASDKEVQILLNGMRKAKGEGFILKKLNARYTPNRNRNFLKVKTWEEAEYDITKWEYTGVGKGFVIHIDSDGKDQKIVCNDLYLQELIMKGHKRVEIRYLSKGEDGALRFPSLRRLI